MLLLAVEWGGTQYSWNSPTIIGLFCGSAAALLLFLVWEHKRGERALLPLSILKQRIVWSSCLQTFFICANMVTTSYYMALYFQAVRDKTPTVSGVYLLPAILSQMFFGIAAGVLGSFYLASSSSDSFVFTGMVGHKFEGANDRQLLVWDITSHGQSQAGR